MRQLAVPFFVLNVMLLLFQLATFFFLEPGSANYVVGLLASVFFLLNIAIAGALLRSDWDI